MAYVDGNTLLAINFSENNIVDVMGNNLPNNLTVGLPSLDSSIKRYGTTSAYFDGNHAVGIPYNEKFNFGTGDFTIDFWYRQPQSGNIYTNDAACILGQDGRGYMIVFFYRGSLSIGKGNEGFQTQFSTSIRRTDNEFHHFAIVRSGGTVYLFIDGNLQESGANNTSYQFTSSGYIGIGNQNLDASHNGVIGWINGYRISNIARWTSDFTPPETPFVRIYRLIKEYLNNKVWGIDSNAFDVVINDWSSLSNSDKESAFKTYGFDKLTNNDIELITNPFSLMAYAGTNNDLSIDMIAVPKSQIVTPKGLILLSGYDSLDAVMATVSESGNGEVRMAVTTDLTTYKVYNSSMTAWETIAVADIPTDGMTAAQLAAIPSSAWGALNADGIGVAYSLAMDSSTDTANVDALSITVDFFGELESKVQGTDYDYSYPANNVMHVKLYKSGDFKINYNPGES